IDGGRHTGALPGRALRRGRAADWAADWNLGRSARVREQVVVAVADRPALAAVGVEAVLGRLHRGLDRAAVVRLGPADRQPRRDPAGLEPGIARVADALDVVDRLDLVCLEEQDAELSDSQPREAVGL